MCIRLVLYITNIWVRFIKLPAHIKPLNTSIKSCGVIRKLRVNSSTDGSLLTVDSMVLLICEFIHKLAISCQQITALQELLKMTWMHSYW